jgi:hypothetical protein
MDMFIDKSSFLDSGQRTALGWRNGQQSRAVFNSFSNRLGDLKCRKAISPQHRSLAEYQRPGGEWNRFLA